MPEFETIIYRPADKIARITLNSPEKRNAISLAMRHELTTAFKMAERDDDISVVLVDAVGPVFCSGADITPPAGDQESARLFGERVAKAAIRWTHGVQ